MNKEITRIDMRDKRVMESFDEVRRSTILCNKINHVEPYTEEYMNYFKELFGNNIEENSYINAPVQIDMAKNIKIAVVNSSVYKGLRGL